jgi:Flp pilus assembly protein CpaB
MRRIIYLSICSVLALSAAVLTLRAQRTVAVVVATRDVGAGSLLGPGDLEVRHVSPEGIPSGVIAAPDEAGGRYVVWPLTAGEPVLSRAVRTQRSGGAVDVGYTVPAGFRAVAVPLQPAGAVGGMLTSGDHVDVYATPATGRQQGTPATGAVPGDGGATLIGRDVLVLQLRSDQGQALDSPAGGSAGTVHGLNFGSGKLGSVVLAIPGGDVDRYAAAASSMTIYLALNVG